MSGWHWSYVAGATMMTTLLLTGHWVLAPLAAVVYGVVLLRRHQPLMAYLFRGTRGGH